MTIEKKIADMIEESKKLQALAEESNDTDDDIVDESETDESVDETDETVSESTEETVNTEETHIDMSADVEALFNGEEGLTEEFRQKAETIFEAAVISRTKSEVARIEEEFDTRLNEQVESIKEGLIEKVDGYLNYMVEQWMTDNELALESGLKNDIFESFIHGMKGLFEQHYLDIPEEKADVLGEMEQKISELEEKLDEQFNSNVELNKSLTEMRRTQAIAEAVEGLTDVDQEKFKQLAEELSYDDESTYNSKLQTIKENYFGKKSKKLIESVVTDEPILEEASLSGPMAKYLREINRAK